MIYTLTLNATLDRVLRAPGFAPGGVVRTELAALLAAGKGFNVSRALAELGVGSVAAGLVGGGEERFYRDSFEALGVEVLLAAFEAPTRSNITILDPDSGRETHLRERGPALSGDELASLAERLLARLGAGDVLAFCGSLPPGIPARGLADLLGSARARGARLLVDTSGEALAAAAALAPEVLSVNAAELAGLAGPITESPAGAAAAAREVVALGAGTVLVTLGAGGAVAVTAGGAWHARAGPVEALNTVGAGDAFDAGFLSGPEGDIPEALRTAVACGAAQAASPRIGRLERGEVLRLAAGVELREL